MSKSLRILICGFPKWRPLYYLKLTSIPPHSPIRVLITQLSYHLPHRVKEKQTNDSFFPFQNIILWEESNEMMVMKEVCVFGVIKQLGIIRLTHKKREWWNHIIYLHHLFKFTFYITSCYITYSKKYATVNVYLHHLLKYPFYNKTCYIIYSKRKANMIVAKYISTVIYYGSLIT